MKLLVPKPAEWILSASFLLVISASLSFSQPANLYTFPGPDVDLGQSNIGRVVSGSHYIGGRGDTVYVLREFGSTYCHKSTDRGQTFGQGIRVNSTAGAYNASLKVDSAGVVYVAYQSEDADIYFTKSIDGGQTFASAVKVSDDTIPTAGQSNPVIAVNNRGQIFAAWNDRRTNPWSVFSSASYDGGATFLPNVQINEVGSSSGIGDIAADDSGRAYVAYWGTTGGRSGIILARSSDSGQNYTERVVVNDSLWFTGFFSMAISPTGLVGIAWEGFQDTCTYVLCSLRFSVSLDYGQTFAPSLVLDNSGQPQKPSLIFENGVYYVVWRATHRRTPSGPYFDHIWFSYSRDSGKTFVPFKDAVPDDTNWAVHFRPSVWTNEMERVFVAWTDTRWDPWFDEDHHLFVSVGKPAGVKGDLDFDGIITGKDIVLELNAVFFGLPFPAPAHRADLNCDWKQTAVDLVLLLNWWYLNTPFPCSQ